MEGPSTSSAHKIPDSVFSKLVEFLKDLPQPNCLNPNDADPAAASATQCLNCKGCRSANRLNDSRKQAAYIESTLGKMSTFEHDMGKQLEAAKSVFNQSGMDIMVGEPIFEELFRAVDHFKFQLPYTSLYQFPEINQEAAGLNLAGNTEDGLTPATMELNYNRLTREQQKCLLYCSVFDGAFKKRVLINWWIGEGLVQGRSTSLETEGESILKILEEQNFVAPILKRKRPAPNTWQMEPGVQSFLCSKWEEQITEAVLLKSDVHIGKAGTNPAKTVFNVNKSTVASTESKIMAYMESLKVLYLGKSRPKQHVQVKGLKSIMDRLNKMKQLRLLCLGGISSIEQLPLGIYIPTSLMVLDLRGCQALKFLPSNISVMKNLRHLDVSDCHILQQIPKDIRLLSRLEILKGFVIGNSISCCSLEDLRRLKKLHKLSICVSRADFPQQQDLVNLANIQGLLKLKILWRVAPNQNQPIIDPVQNEDTEESQAEQITAIPEPLQIEQAPENGGSIDQQEQANRVISNPISPAGNRRLFNCCFGNQMSINYEVSDIFMKLEKLDVWCAPASKGQLLLAPQKFPSLKQLYIRGGAFHQLPTEPWPKVETLRLLFLAHFHMIWGERSNLFPVLSYLEMQNCPNLDEFSQHCDQEGVWINQ